VKSVSGSITEADACSGARNGSSDNNIHRIYLRLSTRPFRGCSHKQQHMILKKKRPYLGMEQRLRTAVQSQHISGKA
jgi:hypothetical protein